MFEGKRVFDVTRKIVSGMTVWPGDSPVKLEQTSSIARGDIVNVTRMDMGVHTGTHMDAPLHFLDQTGDIASVPLDRLLGKVLVVEKDEMALSSDVMKGYDLSGINAVFFKTTSSDLDEFTPFQASYPAITADCAAYLVQSGINTVGIDYISIECCSDGKFPAHYILLENNVAIVENLCLKGIDPGVYDYVCLPLKLAGSDGSPVRTLLFR